MKATPVLCNLCAMPRFEPFSALRYRSANLDSVIAPPYDVLSESDIAVLKARDSHNIAWIDDPEGGPTRYSHAADTLHQWMIEGVLGSDADPSFTIYRMAFTDATGASRVISGVLGGLEVVDEGEKGKASGKTTVLPHERTTKKAVTDRLDLTRATAVNTSPVWGLSLAQGLTEALKQPGIPAGEITVDGVRHSVERVSDQTRIAQIRSIIESDDVLIADGHHRYSISRTYRDEVRAATGRTDTRAEQTLAFINELVDDQLSIEAIHRLIDDIDFDQLCDALSRFFDIEPMSEALSPNTLAEMNDKERLVLLNPNGSVSWLTAKPGAFDGVRSLDGAWLEKALGDTSATFTYQHGLGEMREMVSGHSAGILIRPTSLTEIMRTAREGLLMPPKSTFFTPKLRTGFVMRPTEGLPR